jgi:hypothetical protein
MTRHDRHNFRKVVVSGVLGGHNLRGIVPLMTDGERG